MRIVLACLLTALVTAGAAQAHHNRWAFKAEAVRARESGLRFSFNRLFPDFGPHEVRCRGLEPVRAARGRGYRHIRCRIVSMSVPDFIWHLDARGRVFATRAW